MIFACGLRMNPSSVKGALFVVNPFFCVHWQSVNLGDLEFLGDFGTHVKRVCIVVGIGVLN